MHAASVCVGGGGVKRKIGGNCNIQEKSYLVFDCRVV